MERKIKPQKVLLWRVLGFLWGLKQFWIGFYRSIDYLENWTWVILRGASGDINSFWKDFNKDVYIQDGIIYEDDSND